MRAAGHDALIPATPSPRVRAVFASLVASMTRRRFHAVRLARGSRPVLESVDGGLREVSRWSQPAHAVGEARWQTDLSRVNQLSALATRGFTPEPGFELDPLDVAVLNLKILTRLLDLGMDPQEAVGLAVEDRHNLVVGTDEPTLAGGEHHVHALMRPEVREQRLPGRLGDELAGVQFVGGADQRPVGGTP